MIKITRFYNSDEIERYYNFLISKNIKKLGEKIVSLLNKLPKKENENNKLKFKDLITMDFPTLKRYCNSLDTVNPRYNKIISHKINEQNLNAYKKQYKKIFTNMDTTIQIKNNISLVKNLGVTVCPYCNRNYINSRDDKLGCEFDHYYCKDKYPFFALTLSNLIPSCSTCNRIKSKNHYEFCPFDLEDNKKIEFKVSPPSSYSKIDLVFSGFQEAKDILNLDAAYQIHKSDVDDMFEREQQYCNGYLKYLLNLLGMENQIGKNLTESFFDIMIFGEIAKDNFDDYSNISLSKLKKTTYDCIVQLREN